MVIGFVIEMASAAGPGNTAVVKIDCKPGRRVVAGTAIIAGKYVLRRLARCSLSVMTTVTTLAANIVMIETTGYPGIGVVAIAAILTGYEVARRFAGGGPAVVAGVTATGNVCMIKTGASKGDCVVAFTTVLIG